MYELKYITEYKDKPETEGRYLQTILGKELVSRILEKLLPLFWWTIMSWKHEEGW